MEPSVGEDFEIRLPTKGSASVRRHWELVEEDLDWRAERGFVGVWRRGGAEEGAEGKFGIVLVMEERKMGLVVVVGSASGAEAVVAFGAGAGTAFGARAGADVVGVDVGADVGGMDVGAHAFLALAVVAYDELPVDASSTFSDEPTTLTCFELEDK